jgi:putative flippase GtrA
MGSYSLRFLKYGLSGIAAAIVDFLVFLLFFYFLSHNDFLSMRILSPSTTANIAGTLAGFFCGFLLQKYWAFQSKGKTIYQLIAVGTLLVINIIVTSYVILILNNNLGIPVEIAKIMTQIMVIAWNFIILNFIIFKK